MAKRKRPRRPFNGVLRKLRIAKGFKSANAFSKAFAKHIGLESERSNISRWEHRKAKPTKRSIKEIIGFLGLNKQEATALRHSFGSIRYEHPQKKHAIIPVRQRKRCFVSIEVAKKFSSTVAAAGGMSLETAKILLADMAK